MAGVVVTVLPFLWMLSTSLKEAGQTMTFPPKWIPEPVVWRNYIKILGFSDPSSTGSSMPYFGRFFINSLIVSLSVVAGKLVVCSLGAYAFARLTFPGRDLLFLVYLATMMIPFQVTVIPLYVLMKTLGWHNTYLALITPGIFSAFGTFLLRQFFLTIPSSLQDAAIVDGCSHFRIYLHVILPLSKPALATLGVFAFMTTWNAFLWPLIVINDIEMFTLPLGLAAFQGLYVTHWNLMMAAALISTIPILLAFIFAQRFFVRGIALTGIKG